MTEQEKPRAKGPGGRIGAACGFVGLLALVAACGGRRGNSTSDPASAPEVATPAAAETVQDSRAARKAREEADVAAGHAAAAATEAFEAVAVAKAYKSNELGADARFKGKWVKVTGVVHTVGKDLMGSPYVSLDGPRNSITGVQCFLTDSAVERAAMLSKGNRATLVGRVEGLMMNVLVKDCGVLSAQIN